MDQELSEKITCLRIPGLIDEWDNYVAESAKRRLSHDRFLRYIIDETYKKQQERLTAARLIRAKIPEKWVLQTFPFGLQPKLPKEKILALYDSGKYLTAGQGIIFIGLPGVGKSGLATSFLMGAIARGYKARFIRFIDLLEELNQSVAVGTSKKVINTFANYDCLLIDEIGYVETDATQVGLFFRLMQARHKKKSTLITTNLGFGDWGGFLKNPHLTAALIDRITENCHIFNFKGCHSLRPKNPEEPTQVEGNEHGK